MPTLKQLTCNVEWSDSSLVLPEYRTSYADGFVETYIAIPSTYAPFSIHLQSNGYVAPGLAMFVYMDGVYQCNRNRHNLKIPDGQTTRKQTEVDFRVRQKEESNFDGTFNGKQWTFEKLNVVSNPREVASISAPHNGEYVGTIEVVVLRCLGFKSSSPKSGKAPVAKSSLPAHAPEPKVPRKSIIKSVSSESSDADDYNDDSSSESSVPKKVTSYDGAYDDAPHLGGTISFGGDMAWDNPPGHGRSASMNPNRGPHEYVAKGPGSFSGKRGPHQWVEDENPRGSQFEGGHNSSRSKDKISPSYIPGHSTASNAADRVRVNSTSPAVVININQQQQEPTTRFRAPMPLKRTPTAEINWDDPSEASSWASRRTPYMGEKQGNMVPENQNKKEGGWQTGPQGNANDGGGWQTRPPYNDSGRVAGHSLAASVLTEPPVIPGAWKASPDPTRRTDNNWEFNKNKNNNNNGGAAPNLPTKPDPGQKQTWDNGEYKIPHQNQRDHEVGRNAGGGNNQNQDHSWGKADNNHNWTQPPPINAGEPYLQTWAKDDKMNNRKLGVHEKSSSPILFTKSPEQMSGLTSSYPGGKQPGQYGGWMDTAPAQQGPKPVLEHSPLPVWPESPENSLLARLDGRQNLSPPGKNPNAESSVPLMANPQPKPYWSSWKQSMETNDGLKDSAPGLTPGEPLYKVPLKTAQRKNVSHQVHVSKPSSYTHRTSTPIYMDSHEKPYAVFLFQYRSKTILEKMLNVKLNESEGEKRQRLNKLSKEELIEQLLNMKTQMNATPHGSNESITSGTTNSGGSKKTIKGHMDNHQHSQTAAPLNIDAITQKVSNLRMADTKGSEHRSSNPSYHWDRNPQAPPNNKVPSWNNEASGWKNQSRAPSNHEIVADWLDNGDQGGRKQEVNTHGGNGWTGNGGSGANLGGNTVGKDMQAGGIRDGKVNGTGKQGGDTQAGTSWDGKVNWTGEPGGVGDSHNSLKAGNGPAVESWGGKGDENQGGETWKAGGDNNKATDNDDW